MPVQWAGNEGSLLPQAFDEVRVAQTSAENVLTPPIELGTVAEFHDMGSTKYGTGLFRYVRYTGGTQQIAGEPTTGARAVFFASEDDNYLVTADVSEGFGAAGILHNKPSGVLNENSYIWIQLTGICAFTGGLVITGSTALNDRLIAPVSVGSGNDGELEILSIGFTDVDTPIVEADRVKLERRTVAEVTKADEFLMLDFPH